MWDIFTCTGNTILLSDVAGTVKPKLKHSQTGVLITIHLLLYILLIKYFLSIMAIGNPQANIFQSCPSFREFSL